LAWAKVTQVFRENDGRQRYTTGIFSWEDRFVDSAAPEGTAQPYQGFDNTWHRTKSLLDPTRLRQPNGRANGIRVADFTFDGTAGEVIVDEEAFAHVMRTHRLDEGLAAVPAEPRPGRYPIDEDRRRNVGGVGGTYRWWKRNSGTRGVRGIRTLVANFVRRVAAGSFCKRGL